MPSEQELRDGLRNIANRAPRGTDSDLAAARGRGRVASRNRRLAAACVLTLLVVSAAATWTLLNDGQQASTSFADPPSTTIALVTTTTTTLWTAPADDPTQPSPDAVAADRDFRAAPADLLDCGVHVRTSGWPTTFFGNPAQVDCVIDAADAGTPAQFVTTARDFVGGMEGTIFRVLGPEEILVINYAADPAGTITSSETTCPSLSLPNYPIPVCG